MKLLNIEAPDIQKSWEPYLNKISAEVVANWQCSNETKWFLVNIGIQTYIGVNGNGWAQYTPPRLMTINGINYITLGTKDFGHILFVIQEKTDIVTMLDEAGKYSPDVINSTILNFMKFVTASRYIFDMIDDSLKSSAFVELRQHMKLLDPPAFASNGTMWPHVLEEWIDAYYVPDNSLE